MMLELIIVRQLGNLRDALEPFVKYVVPLRRPVMLLTLRCTQTVEPIWIVCAITLYSPHDVPRVAR